MYSVSDSYKKALLENHITDKVEGSIVLGDGTVIELRDSTIVTGSLKICHELCDDYRIGTFNLGSMHIGFFDDNALGRDFSGAKITLAYKIETESGWESVPLGIFIADGQSVIRRRNTVTLTAYDYGILFDCTLGTTIRNMSGTAESIISAVCERCGVEFAGIADGLPNTRISVSPSSQQIQSCRDLVGWCAALLCGYAVINREGQLQIISARYAVDQEDTSEIIVDKYLTSAERNSICSTDTRAWIAQMSAYSAGEAKIYRSNLTREDSQAARAVYYLENNPLTEGMSESLCDTINCNWLAFIDSFMQRGITAELYGDPALDVGDIIRCSEGDIDQRRSVVGLVTKQEWRYRNYHTVICASAQLSDGFEENDEEGSSSSGAEAVGETDSVYPVKVIEQSKKKVTAPGEEYSAGPGLTLSNNTFGLKWAGTADDQYGGVNVSWSPTADYDNPGVINHNDQHYGIYRRDTPCFIALRTATRFQKGGLFLGDGLVPLIKSSESDSGTSLTNTEFVQLRLGEGLEFTENNEATTDVKEKRENDFGGRRVAVTKATNDKFGAVKIGNSLGIAEDGSLYVMMTGGYGIDVSESGEISAKIDNSTIIIDGNGKLAAAAGGGDGVAIENAVVIQEADAKYLLHNYIEVKYIAGNRVGYAGAGNQIIAGGYILLKDGTALDTSGSAMYTEATFPKGGATAAAMIDNYHIYMEVGTISTNATAVSWKDNVSATQLRGASTYDVSRSGLNFYWSTIYPPDGTHPYGYVAVKVSFMYVNSSGNLAVSSSQTKYIEFASEAEYNAAIGLTYEPNELTEVQEAVTEV